MENKQEIRCINCEKLLGRVPKNTIAKIEIKCPKCKYIHTYQLGLYRYVCK